jgi:DegV family protein with EDD domain
MGNYVIATSSTCDIEREWLDAHHVPVISYSFEIDGQIYKDDCREATRRRFYSTMREGKLPNTSQINSYAYYEFFKDLIEDGEAVVFVDMDRAISNSYANSLAAADMIRDEYPDAQLYIMDTSCITMGLAFLIKKLVAMKENGASKEEVMDWCNSNAKKIAHRFMVDDLQWLRKGGRLSNASAIVGSLLSIKPLIYLPEDGSLVAYEKVRGRKKALRTLLDSVIRDVGEAEGMEFIVGHSDTPEEGEAWKQTVMEQFPKAKSVELMELGPTIGSHIGPGFISIVYLAEERRP